MKMVHYQPKRWEAVNFCRCTFAMRMTMNRSIVPMQLPTNKMVCAQRL